MPGRREAEAGALARGQDRGEDGTEKGRAVNYSPRLDAEIAPVSDFEVEQIEHEALLDLAAAAQRHLTKLPLRSRWRRSFTRVAALAPGRHPRSAPDPRADEDASPVATSPSSAAARQSQQRRTPEGA